MHLSSTPLIVALYRSGAIWLLWLEQFIQLYQICSTHELSTVSLVRVHRTTHELSTLSPVLCSDYSDTCHHV